MKKYFVRFSIIIFASLFLNSYVWAGVKTSDVMDVLNAISETSKQEEIKRQKQIKQEEFDRKITELVKNLPISARVVVPDVKVLIPELDSPASDTETEEARLKIKKNMELMSEQIRLGVEAQLEALGKKVVERDAFKEIEKEIVYSQTGEIDPNSSAKFGKAVGATHMLLLKVLYNGLGTAHPTATISLRAIEVESMLRVGSVIATFDIDVPKNDPKMKISPPLRTQTLLESSFHVNPGTDKTYSWNFKADGILNVTLTANSDVHLYLVDVAINTCKTNVLFKA